jgi:sugar fermentation stimulation protein A
VKNVHLMRQTGLAEFPDCVTARGAKHLFELAAQVRAGARAAMLYILQRDDCDRFALADDIDPGYAQAFRDARAAGVEAFAYACEVSPEGVKLKAKVQMLNAVQEV